VRVYDIADDMVDQIFDFLVRDFAEFALQLHNKASSTADQMQHCLRMIAKPVTDDRRYDAVWQGHVLALDGAYEMNA
jgi:acyl-CoA dehydrogenase